MTKPNDVPDVAVIVCVHNAPDYIRACIESVLRYTVPPYELVIVDDGSAFETKQLLQEYAASYKHIILTRNEAAQGYTRAANKGLRATRCHYRILLNSDTVVGPQWAQRMVACAASSSKLGVVGALSNAATYQSVPYVFDGQGFWKQNYLPDHVTVSRYAKMIARISKQLYPRVPVANGFCFLITTPLLEAIGYLDEETFPRGYGEENDFCLRASDAGFEVAVADDVFVYHATSKSFGVKQREALTGSAHQAIRDKHGDVRLAQVDQALRHHAIMDEVRENVLEAHRREAWLDAQDTARVMQDLPRAYADLSVLWVLDRCDVRSGGAQMVVELAQGLAELGVPVQIAVDQKVKAEYLAFYAGAAALFRFTRNESELMELAAGCAVVVATMWHTVAMVRDLCARFAQLRAAYFVQDYEPYFYTGKDPQNYEAARASYTLMDEITMFAISPWVCDVVQQEHGRNVQKIPGCLDTGLFFPDLARARKDAPVHVVAMVRVHTPWRGTAMTLRVLKQLKQAYGERIRISIFGSKQSALADSDLEHDFEYTNYAYLTRGEVAHLMRHADVFLDLSDFQAFGRPALEAMACGVAVVAPLAGGVHEFGVDGKNILLIDTKDEAACMTAARSLIEDEALRARLGAQACADAQSRTLRLSTLGLLRVLLA